MKGSYLKTVESWAGHRGKAELIRYLKGESISRAESQLAFCYGCNAGYSDGAKDCEMTNCPMHPYMPYNTTKKKSGRAGKVLSEEHKAAMQAGRRKKIV